MTTQPEEEVNLDEVTRMCVEALRKLAGPYYDQHGPMGVRRYVKTADALEAGDIRIVDTDLLRTLQKAGVLDHIVSGEKSWYCPTRFCRRLIDKVASGEEVLVDAERHATLEKVVDEVMDWRQNGYGSTGHEGRLNRSLDALGGDD